uniref:Leucine rich immune protein (Coil-less) n=1 Tax=Anopheles epiroticus TaxID=199890 RepID=A0A9I3FGJ4_9DIPT
METPLKSVIFHETHNLVDVRIDRSHLTTIPDTIFVQESLETLFITRSLLTTIDFDLFEKLPNLQFISFYSNKISVVHSTPGIACCGRWLSLDLQNNRLEKFDLGVFSFMSCLKTVSLRTNRLLTIENNVPSETPPGMRRSCQSYDYQASVSADRFSSLNTIDLENNRLRVVNLSMFHDMPHLTDLMLARNLLMNVIVHNGLLPKRLESIDLSFNRMANADFRPLLSVKVVNVGGNL